MAGIGGFGRAMIPLGNAAGTALSQFNQLQDRSLRNQLAQQDMALKQREADLQMRQQMMQEAQTKFAMGHEVYNQKQQIASQQAAAAMFSGSGNLAKSPEERQFWDNAANAAYNHMPPEYIFQMAKSMGFDDEVKQQLEMYRAMYYGSAATLNAGKSGIAEGVMSAAGFGGPGGGSFSPGTTMPTFPGLTGPSSGYSGIGAPSGYSGAPSAPRPMMTPSAPMVAPTFGGGVGYGGVRVPAGVSPTIGPSAGSGGGAPPGARWAPTGDKYWDPRDGEIHDARSGAVVGG